MYGYKAGKWASQVQEMSRLSGMVGMGNIFSVQGRHLQPLWPSRGEAGLTIGRPSDFFFPRDADNLQSISILKD